jgi:hypothetical protein
VATAIKGTTSWNNPQTGNLGGNNTTWGLSGGADLHAANASGWQLVQFTLTSSTSGKGYQLYNLDARATTGLALSDVDTSACAQHDLSQPFLDGGDSYWYALAPGESTDTFDAGGWTLSGGANIAQAQLADGALGAVLDLPPGAQAVSPFMCVSSDFKLARAQIRNLTAGSGNVTLAAAIQHTTSWNNPHTGNLGGGNGTGWTLSGSVDLQPANAAGWQLVQFTLTNTSSTRESQVYNLATQASDALALASVDTSACVPPQLSQPFLFAGDTRWYTPTPGESSAGLDGTGWTLSGGAGIVQGQLPNGSTGPVLDLPAGSQAVTPVMCVNQDYPLARAHMRPVSGDGTVGMYVAYKGTSSWNNPDHSADLHGPNSGWGLSGTGNINPGKTPGWQLVQITLQAGAKGGSQVYDFEIDPRMSH